MIEPYVVNVSSIQSFMQCRWRWTAAYVFNRVPVNEARPFRFGKLLHVIFEDFFKGAPMENVIADRALEWRTAAESATNEFDRLVAMDALEDLQMMAEPLTLWRDKFPFERTLEVEVPFEIAHPQDPLIRLRGRPDRVGVLYGRIWHVQNRGLAAGINFGVYLDLAKRHYHEHVYAEALSKKYGICENGCVGCDPYEYGGTVFNLMRKLKYRTKMTKANPLGETKAIDEVFWQHPMAIDIKGLLHTNVMNDIRLHAHEMKRVEAAARDMNWPAPNEYMNGGMFGNRPDEYYRVLTGEIELTDDRYFKDRIDMYDNTEATA